MTIHNILIVDDHPVVADAIGLALRMKGFEVQGAANARTMRLLLAECGAKLPDLVILDIDLPDADGVDLVAEIHKQRLPVLIFSGLYDWMTVSACKRNGACGFVGKSSKPDALISAIEAILLGGQFFPPAFLTSEQHAMHGPEALNDRQREVLDLLMDGNSNKSIAEHLALSEGSVKNIVTHLLQHFDVESRQKLLTTIQKIGYRARVSRAIHI